MTTSIPFDALILAGASSERLDGADKALVRIGDSTLLERSVRAVAHAEKVIVVGPRRAVDLDVTWCDEERPGGPVAAIASGLALVTAPTVVVLAVDHPSVDPQLIADLVQTVDDIDGAAVGVDGRPIFLVGAYRTASLSRRIGSMPEVDGAPVRAMMQGLDLALLDAPEAARDCDTWDDMRDADARFRAGGNARVR